MTVVSNQQKNGFNDQREMETHDDCNDSYAILRSHRRIVSERPVAVSKLARQEKPRHRLWMVNAGPGGDCAGGGAGGLWMQR